MMQHAPPKQMVGVPSQHSNASSSHDCPSRAHPQRPLLQTFTQQSVEEPQGSPSSRQVQTPLVHVRV